MDKVYLVFKNNNVEIILNTLIHIKVLKTFHIMIYCTRSNICIQCFIHLDFLRVLKINIKVQLDVLDRPKLWIINSGLSKLKRT